MYIYVWIFVEINYLLTYYIHELITMCIGSNIPGRFIDNRTNSSIPGDVLSINILMYDDDICAVNDTIGRIQSQMNILR